MRVRGFMAAILMLLMVLGGAGAQERKEISAVCLILTKADPRSEAGKLSFERMLLEPELTRWLPTRFTLESGRYSMEASASVPYRMVKTTFIAQSGELGLYAVTVSFVGLAPPRPDKKVQVSFPLDELLLFGGVIQPSQRALELAARKGGLGSGYAWLMEIERLRNGTIRASVGFDLP